MARRGRHFLGQRCQRRRGFTQSPGDDSRAERTARAAARAGQRKFGHRCQHRRRHPAGRRPAAQHQPLDGQTGLAQQTNMPFQLEGQSFEHGSNDMAGAVGQLHPGDSAFGIGREASDGQRCEKRPADETVAAQRRGFEQAINLIASRSAMSGQLQGPARAPSRRLPGRGFAPKALRRRGGRQTHPA